jgi:hypothetical protein
MVGLIHKTLFDLVESIGGQQAVKEVRLRAGIPETEQFRMNAAYDDAEWRRILAATCHVLGITAGQAEEVFADFFCKDALTRWPMWFQISKDSRDFLLRQPAMHNSLAAGLTDPHERQAVTDKFRVMPIEEGVVVHYRSPNQHCGLYKALARWVINHYGDAAVIEELQCTRRGAPECEIRIQWTRRGTGR